MDIFLSVCFPTMIPIEPLPASSNELVDIRAEAREGDNFNAIFTLFWLYICRKTDEKLIDIF